MITVERCSCGRCHNYWLVGVGSFVQGSGFTKEEAENIAYLLNRQAAKQELTKSAHSADPCSYSADAS